MSTVVVAKIFVQLVGFDVVVPEYFASKLMAPDITDLQRTLAEYEYKSYLLDEDDLQKTIRSIMKIRDIRRTINYGKAQDTKEQQEPKQGKRKQQRQCLIEKDDEMMVDRVAKRRKANFEEKINEDDDGKQKKHNEGNSDDYATESDLSDVFAPLKNDLGDAKKNGEDIIQQNTSEANQSTTEEDYSKLLEAMAKQQQRAGLQMSNTTEESIHEETAANTGNSDSEEESPQQHLHNAKWIEYYLELVEYKKEHGNLKVSSKYSKLSWWVWRQRQAGRAFLEGKNKFGMTKDRFELLGKLGFDWDPKLSFKDYFEMLKKFKEKHGHAIVPTVYKENQRLANWAMTMRQAGNHPGKRDKRGLLTPEMKEQLDEIGFGWNKLGDVWMKNYDRLKRYKEEHGDCNVPKRYAADPKLANWVQHTRRQYKSYQSGKGAFTPERIKLLEEIGFIWKVGTNFVHLKNAE